MRDLMVPKKLGWKWVMHPLNAGTQDATMAMLSSIVDQRAGDTMFPKPISILRVAICCTGALHV